MAARTFVLLHGAFHGGWCWSRVAGLLRARGHRVSTPTQTGLGERRHLLSPAITLDTFVDDLVEYIEAEELEAAVLVGHSFGGLAISGAADRIPDRIRQLVFLDSRILQPGLSVEADSPGPMSEERRARMDPATGGVAPPDTTFGVPDGPDADWVRRRMTPHPHGTFTSPLRLDHPVGNGLPCAYVECTSPRLPSLAASAAWARAQPGWAWRELDACHDCMVTAPEATAAVLEELAAGAG